MIAQVAIRFHGKIYSLPAPNRHHHLIRLIIDETGVNSVDARNDDQGFLDENGTFYQREPALLHALKCNQVKDISKIRCGMLFSEDVW